MSEAFAETVASFGRNILSPSSEKAVIEPHIDISPDVFLQLLQLIQSDVQSEFNVGLVNISSTLIAELWPSMTGAQKDMLKNEILRISAYGFHPLAVGRYSNSCIFILNNSNWEWCALFDLVFSPKPTQIMGNVFVKIMSVSKTEFVESNIKKIYKALEIMMDFSDSSILVGLFAILSNLDSEEAMKNEPTLYEKLMSCVFRVLNNEPDRSQFVIPIISDILAQAPSFNQKPILLIQEQISNITDVKSAIPVMRMFPIIPYELVLSIIMKLIEISNDFVSKTNGVPKELIDAIEAAPIESFPDSSAEAMADFFKVKVAQKDNIPVLFVFAPFAAQVADVFGEESLFKIVESCFNKTPISICSGLKIYESLSYYSESLSFPIPETISNKVLQYLTFPDQLVRTCCYSALRAIVENDFELDAECASIIFGSFSSIPETDKVNYFKLIRHIFRAGNSDETFSEPAMQFVLNHGSNKSDPKLLSEILSVICSISDNNKDFIEPCIDLYLPIAIEMMKGDDPVLYKYASRALVPFTLSAAESARRPVLSLLPRFISILSPSSSVSPKIQGNVAVAYCTIVVCLSATKEYNNIKEIALRFISSNEIHLVSSGSILAELLREANEQPLGLELYSSIVPIAIKTGEKDLLNPMLIALRKLHKVYKIPESTVLPLLSTLLSGIHPVFGRKPPSAFSDKETEVYSYLRAIARYYPKMAQDITNVAISWFSQIHIDMYPSILNLLGFLTENSYVSGKNLFEMSEVLFAQISGTKADLDEIMLQLLMTLVSKEPKSINIDSYMAKMLFLWQELVEMDPSSWRAEVASAILELTSLGGEINEETVVEILADFPYDPEYNTSEKMAQSLVKMMEDMKKWASIVPIIAKTITDLLMQPKEELQKHDFSKNTMNGLKGLLKEILKNNKSIEREILKSFNKNRQLQNKFNNLFK